MNGYEYEHLCQKLARFDIHSKQYRTKMIWKRIVKTISSDAFFDTEYLTYRYNCLMFNPLDLNAMGLERLDDLIIKYGRDFEIAHFIQEKVILRGLAPSYNEIPMAFHIELFMSLSLFQSIVNDGFRFKRRGWIYQTTGISDLYVQYNVQYDHEQPMYLRH